MSVARITMLKPLSPSIDLLRAFLVPAEWQEPTVSCIYRSIRMTAMTRLPIAFLLLTLTVLPVSAQSVLEELDAYWAEVSRTVAEGDFEGYAAAYHPDAVLVFASSNQSVPLQTALAGWQPGFEATAAGEMSASVSFRFSQRLVSETTAWEKGIFYYQSETSQGASGAMIHFTALSVKKDGKWLMLMENQMTEATQEEWDALED